MFSGQPHQNKMCYTEVKKVSSPGANVLRKNVLPEQRVCRGTKNRIVKIRYSKLSRYIQKPVQEQGNRIKSFVREL
jgi:hypothetical protein